MKSLRTLPRPDQFGNYWFGDPRARGDTGSWDATAPAIFRLLTHNKQGVAWVASLGARGMLWSGTELRVFGSPEEALAEIRARMA